MHFEHKLYEMSTDFWQIGLLQLVITWYKIRHAGGQAHYYSRTQNIDDMFVACSSDHITSESVFFTANSLNSALKFTIETPDNNRLPFLDTMVTLHPQKGSFSSTLFIKPIHSQCLTPWDSHVPLSLKRGSLIGQIKRAITRSTDAQSQHASIKLITKLHKRNGYPKRFVTSTIKRILRTCNIQPKEQELEQDPVYMFRELVISAKKLSLTLSLR